MDIKNLLRSKPVTQIETSAGCIYLYPLRMCDITDFEKLEPGAPISQIRQFLPSISSLTEESDESPDRIPLDPETTKTLSDYEVEQVAEAYALSSEWQHVREGVKDRKPVARKDEESASAYLIRLVKEEIQNQHQATKKMHEKILSSSRSVFDQVRKSYTDLGSTVKAFEAISRPAIKSSLSRENHEFNDSLAKQSARMARERTEELEMVRLTGKMTAESARTLKDLAEAATTLMEQFDERDRKADKTTRKQISIAVWSVGVSAVLALLALIISGFAYLQDRNNSVSGVKWQEKLLIAVEKGNLKFSTVERENEILRGNVDALKSRVVDLETTVNTVVEASRKAPADLSGSAHSQQP